MIDLGILTKAKKAWRQFSSNHTKIEDFIKDVKNKGFVEDQEIAIAVRYPDGTEYKAGIKVKEGDLDLLEMLKSLSSHL